MDKLVRRVQLGSILIFSGWSRVVSRWTPK